MKLKLKIPYAFFCLFLLCAVLLFVSLISSDAADYINSGICQSVRDFLGTISSVLHISIFELFIFASPIFIIFAVLYIKRADSKKNITRRFVTLLSLLSIFPSLYILTLGISYLTPSLTESYGNDVEYGELVSAAEILAEKANYLSSFSLDTQSLSDLRKDFAKSYEKILYGDKSLPLPKSALTSSFMTRTGTYAQYSFATGEVIINTRIPPYLIPFTVAHEYAHVLGKSSEADADFLAFLACICSETPYVRYSGCLSALEHLLADIYKYDKSKYYSIYKSLEPKVIEDISIHRKFCEKYKKSVSYRVTDKINSAHLDIWDKNGSQSYRKSSRLIAWYLNNPSVQIRIKCSKTTVFWSEQWDGLLYTGVKLSAEKFASADLKMLPYR